jgi:hypothetical protein
MRKTTLILGYSVPRLKFKPLNSLMQSQNRYRLSQIAEYCLSKLAKKLAKINNEAVSAMFILFILLNNILLVCWNNSTSFYVVKYNIFFHKTSIKHFKIFSDTAYPNDRRIVVSFTPTSF